MKQQDYPSGGYRRTWYGWNLDSLGGARFARRIDRFWRLRHEGQRPRKPRHPWIRVALGGLWKPLELQRIRTESKLIHRWKKAKKTI